MGKKFFDHTEVCMRNHKKPCDLGRCQDAWLHFLMELDVSLHVHGGHDGILLKYQHSLGLSQKQAEWNPHLYNEGCIAALTSLPPQSSEIRVVMWTSCPSSLKLFFFFFDWPARQQNQNTESLQFGFLVLELFSFYSYVQNNKRISRWAGVWWQCKTGICSSVQCTVWPLCNWENLIVSLCMQDDELLCCSLNGRARRQLFVIAAVKMESSSNDFPHRCFPCVWM